MIDRLRNECKAAGGGKAWAEKHGLSFSYVYEALRGDKEPGEKILKALRIRKDVDYNFYV